MGNLGMGGSGDGHSLINHPGQSGSLKSPTKENYARI
jgi:hypothetical protein